MRDLKAGIHVMHFSDKATPPNSATPTRPNIQARESMGALSIQTITNS